MAAPTLKGLLPTWRALLIALGIGAAINLFKAIEWLGAPQPPHRLALDTILTTVGPLSILFAGSFAVAAVRRGTAPLSAYARSLLGATLVTVAALACGGVALGVASASLSGFVRTIAADVAQLLGVGGLALFLQYNRRTADAIFEGIRASELKRVRLERQVATSRLAAVRGQIDPDYLRQALTGIKELYYTDLDKAEGQLDTLIEELRHRRAAIRAGDAAGDLPR